MHLIISHKNKLQKVKILNNHLFIKNKNINIKNQIGRE
jgi:hypothetical protein